MINSIVFVKYDSERCNFFGKIENDHSNVETNRINMQSKNVFFKCIFYIYIRGYKPTSRLFSLKGIYMYSIFI